MNSSTLKPICYVVSREGTVWRVRFGDVASDSHEFPTKPRALLFARSAAETRWDKYGRASCVKLREDDGQLTDDVEYPAVGD